MRSALARTSVVGCSRGLLDFGLELAATLAMRISWGKRIRFLIDYVFKNFLVHMMYQYGDVFKLLLAFSASQCLDVL